MTDARGLDPAAVAAHRSTADIAHAGRERQMRGELGGAVERLFEAELRPPPELAEHERVRLVRLARGVRSVIHTLDMNDRDTSARLRSA